MSWPPCLCVSCFLPRAESTPQNTQPAAPADHYKGHDSNDSEWLWNSASRKWQRLIEVRRNQREVGDACRVVVIEIPVWPKRAGNIEVGREPGEVVDVYSLVEIRIASLRAQSEHISPARCAGRVRRRKRGGDREKLDQECTGEARMTRKNTSKNEPNFRTYRSRHK